MFLIGQVYFQPLAVILSEIKIKNYRDGLLFQVFLNDCSGNVYYPNGKLACLVTQDLTSRLTQLYLLDVSSKLVGTFDSRGLLHLNYPEGTTR